jgi:gluconokinase
MKDALPRSPYEIVGGLVFFGRMLDKIRLAAAGTLREDLLPNMGKGFDATCCKFLGVPYEDVKSMALQEPDDNKVLAWACAQGRQPSELDVQLWNSALTRRGWRDDLSQRLRERLAEGGWSDRAGILTFFDYIDLDEGRSPRFPTATA